MKASTLQGNAERDHYQAVIKRLTEAVKANHEWHLNYAKDDTGEGYGGRAVSQWTRYG